MDINELGTQIDQAFEDFYDKLDRSKFGLYISPRTLKPQDDVEVEQRDEEPKELDFS